MRPRQEFLQRLRDHGGQRPPRRGGMRTDPRDERHRQLDGEHRGRGGHRNMSGPAGALHVAVRLPGRTAEPAGQLSRGVGCRHPRVQQVCGGVDPLGEHATTSASATGRPTKRHVTNILLDMSRRRADTPRQFDTPIAQRHLKAEVANCVGGVVSPVLANLFMHYAFDMWMAREYPGVAFERYADDAVVHCTTERQARNLVAAIGDRMEQVGLRLHPDKTKVVYCQDGNRRLRYGLTAFTFLGFTFRARGARTKRGTMFVSFQPAISKDAQNKISGQIRRWRLHRRIGYTLAEIARQINPVVRGWMQYYGAFYRSALKPLLSRINAYVMRWIRNKYKRLRPTKKATACWQRITRQYPRLFAHWAWVRGSWWSG
jgi:RNA-directed DNA polymerase